MRKLKHFGLFFPRTWNGIRKDCTTKDTLSTMTTGSGRKNKHPKRAENNVRTVVVARTKSFGVSREEEGEGDKDVGERLRSLLVCVPCDDVVEQNHQTRKDAKGVKRKRGQHECDVCEKVFRYPSLLAVHMRIHTNEKPYECDVCEMCFRQAGHLQIHVRIHTKEKPYECGVCEKRFTQSSSLKTHMRIHANEKPYECDVCEKRFRKSGTLKKHVRIHTNERPYECHICEKRYRQANGLKYHTRTQHH